MTAFRSVVVLTGLLAVAATFGFRASVPAANAASSDTGSQASVAINEPLARGPARVRTWYYFGLNDVNANVPASIMAHYADYVEDDGNTAEHARAFKAAGGRYAAAYTDPAYVPYCRPPFSPPAGRCEGPLGTRALDESAWFHGRDGTRVRRYGDEHFQYTESLNPLSPIARRAWHDTTAELVRKAPWLDLLFADDAGGPLHAGDMSPMSSQFYGFNDAGTEITSDAVFRDAWAAYLTVAVRPLVINGADPVSGEPAYGGAFLRPARILGAVHEGCFRGGSGVDTDVRDRWRRDADSLIVNTALGKLAICFMMGTPTPENRLYALASWWLTYDPRWSIAAPIDAIPGQSAIVAEMELVPVGALRSARRSVRDLRAENGVYVREFAACYQRGTPIGGCAALVNPSGRALPLPPLDGRYARTLVLDGNDVLHGGRATWAGRMPASVGAASALVLAR